MSEAYVSSISQGAQTLLSQGGVNPNATFQTRQRVAQFPGPNMLYTFSLLPIGANNGIVTPSDGSHHSDTLNSVDETGSFHVEGSYVGSSRQLCEQYRLRFDKAKRQGIHLIPIDELSYVNRRLRAGV